MIFYTITSPTDIAENMGEFLWNLVKLVGLTIQVILDTAERIDSINFTDSAMTHYLGYAKYMMGTPLYTTFTTVLLIAIGVTMWTYLLKGIGYIKNLLPW